MAAVLPEIVYTSHIDQASNQAIVPVRVQAGLSWSFKSRGETSKHSHDFSVDVSIAERASWLDTASSRAAFLSPPASGTLP
jgi:hypothetical protein